MEVAEKYPLLFIFIVIIDDTALAAAFLFDTAATTTLTLEAAQYIWYCRHRTVVISVHTSSYTQNPNLGKMHVYTPTQMSTLFHALHTERGKDYSSHYWNVFTV